MSVDAVAGNTDDAHALLAVVPTDGTSIGNQAARKALGRDRAHYFSIRNHLLDAGLIGVGRGRGGSIHRPLDDLAHHSAAAAAELAATEAEYEAEKDLYEPIAQTLATEWAADARYDKPVVAIIGHQGKRNTGGKWTRPNLVLVAVDSYELVPGVEMNVTSFEVKRGPALDVTAIYEAPGHRRAANYALVIVHEPGLDAATLTVVAEEASRQGIGLIVAADPADYETWDTVVAPVRAETAAKDLNAFLTVQLPDEAKAMIQQRLEATKQQDA